MTVRKERYPCSKIWSTTTLEVRRNVFWQLEATQVDTLMYRVSTHKGLVLSTRKILMRWSATLTMVLFRYLSRLVDHSNAIKTTCAWSLRKLIPTWARAHLRSREVFTRSIGRLNCCKSKRNVSWQWSDLTQPVILIVWTVRNDRKPTTRTPAKKMTIQATQRVTQEETALHRAMTKAENQFLTNYIETKQSGTQKRACYERPSLI